MKIAPQPPEPSDTSQLRLSVSLSDEPIAANYSDVLLPTHLLSGSAACLTIQNSLEAPVVDFYARPSKKFRYRLVEAGFLLATARETASEPAKETASEQNFAGIGETNPRNAFPDPARERRQRQLEVCHALGESLEAIHAGSLIIDDIQDQSAERRGSPTLHKKFGVPLALNAGNWLYFKAFELIRKLVSQHQITDATELRLYRLCHQVMLDAHVGQAIDLGAHISEIGRNQVAEICLASLKLKTGALMALALGAGAVLAEADEATLEMILSIGADLGVSLQMFDDLGNIQLELKNPKRFEDLYLKRPSWIWAAVAQNSSDREYAHFLTAVSELPREGRLIQWFHSNELLPKARRQALVFSNSVMSRFENHFSSGQTGTMAIHIVQTLLERIQISYG